MITALRSLWKLLADSPPEAAAVAPEQASVGEPLTAQDYARIFDRDVKPDNVTLSRAELVTLLGQAMLVGKYGMLTDDAVEHPVEDHRTAIAEKLLDASLARRGSR